MTNFERPIDNTTAHRIIQRAAQLDAEWAEGLTEAQLREVAADLSISEAAVRQAIAEHRAETEVTMLQPTVRLGLSKWRWAGRIAIGGVGLYLIVGILSRIFP